MKNIILICFCAWIALYCLLTLDKTLGRKQTTHVIIPPISVASQTLDASQVFGEPVNFADGLTSGLGITVRQPTTQTNFLTFGDSKGVWLDVSTNLHGWVVKSKREPFLTTTNGDWPWVIRFYDPRLEQRIQFTNPAFLPELHINGMKDDGSFTNVVQLLIESGEICKVRGHAWTPHMHLTLEYAPNRVSCRECSLCRAHQSQIAEWK